VIIRSLALVVDGRDDIVVDLTAPGAVDRLKTMPFTIKEGASFTMKVRFTVQHQVLSGLKYLQVVKRKGLGITLAKDEEMIVRARKKKNNNKTTGCFPRLGKAALLLQPLTVSAFPGLLSTQHDVEPCV
jgi:hypothetical protein